MDRRRGNEIEKYAYYMENHIVSRLAISQLPENRYKIIIYLMQRLGHYKLLQIQLVSISTYTKMSDSKASYTKMCN